MPAIEASSQHRTAAEPFGGQIWLVKGSPHQQVINSLCIVLFSSGSCTISFQNVYEVQRTTEGIRSSRSEPIEGDGVEACLGLTRSLPGW